jgi:hypothetical protein
MSTMVVKPSEIALRALDHHERVMLDRFVGDVQRDVDARRSCPAVTVSVDDARPRAGDIRADPVMRSPRQHNLIAQDRAGSRRTAAPRGSR